MLEYYPIHKPYYLILSMYSLHWQPYVVYMGAAAASQSLVDLHATHHESLASAMGRYVEESLIDWNLAPTKSTLFADY